MPYKENLKKATELKIELDKFRPLTPEMEKRIMQKFRLDWNYHSSHIEGNLLTYGETKALILFGLTSQAKPFKDSLEMRGHNAAIICIEEVIKQERPLTENFTRELHELILKEPYEVDAITPDGKPTKKTITIGQYKTVPNHVKTQTGEIFYFATPEETPAMMADLLKWYNDNKNKTELHPVLFATEFHYRFIRIHPFDDGNGRIARLLMNFILMQKGYPPAIIKTEEKKAYFTALQQADAGQPEYFFNYVCEQVNRSLELMIKGAKGENIEEDDDLDKKLALLKQEVEAEDDDNELKMRLSSKTLKASLDNWGKELLNEIAKTTIKFNEFYDKPNHQISMRLDNSGPYFEFEKNIDFSSFDANLDKTPPEKQLNTADVEFNSNFGAYKKSGLNPFGCNYKISIKFEPYHYEILIAIFNKTTNLREEISFKKQLIHKPISSQDIKEINKIWGDSLLNHLEYHRLQLKKNGK
jgi:Fic family protein